MSPHPSPSSLRPGRPQAPLLPPAATLCALLLLALVLPRPAGAEQAATAGGDAPVRVLEGWRYRWGDGPLDAQGVPAWAAGPGDGEGWSPVEALETPSGRDGQDLLWLSLPLPEGTWEAPALFLGSVSNVVEVYSGGRRLYVSGRLEPGGVETAEHSAWHLVPLPREALGKRVLLRIQSNGRSIGVRRDVRVGPHQALYNAALREEMAAFVLGVLLLAVSVVCAGAFALRRQQRQLGHLAVFTAGAGLMLMVMSGVPTALWGAGRTAFLLQLVGGYFTLPGLTGFVEAAVLDKRRRLLPRAVQALYAFAALLSLATLLVHGSLPRVFPVFLVVSLVTLVACVVLPAREAARGSREARILVAGMTGVLLAGAATVLASFGQLESVGFVLHWGVLALTLSLLGILADRSAQVVHALEVQTRTAEERKQEAQRLAEGMGTSAWELLAAVQQLRTASEQQNSGVGRQATSLQEAQTTVEEIRQTSQLTAEKAMLLAAAASEADDASREGAASLERTLAALNAIRQEVGEMAQRIQALEGRSREIAGVVDVVKGLADQSNMLALNAAIEATRAGEHGKGFGVVAREVRHLADQSLRATERIRTILASVSQSTREAAALSRSGEERVVAGLEEVRASGEQLQRLAAMVGETGQSVRQITAAVSQQDAGTSQIATAMTDLSGQMQRTLEALRQTEAITESVQKLAEGMAGMAHVVR